MNTINKLKNLSDNIMIREIKEKLYRKVNKDNRANKNNVITNRWEEDKEVKCVFCGSKKNLHKYMGNYYCCNCFRELQNLSVDDL